jgi:ketosteroid isomerase-like protein
MADNIVWPIPGHHPFVGEKCGVDEVLAFFDRLAKAGFHAQPFVIAAQGDDVVDDHRGWSNADSGLDLKWCLVFRFENGKIQEVTTFCEDWHKADLLLYEIYKLKPIPDRLA